MELLPVGITDGNDLSTGYSAPFDVAMGAMPTISLKDNLGPIPGREQDYGVGNNAHVFVQIKSGDAFFTVGVLDAGGKDARGVTLAAHVIAASGTFRVFRPPYSMPVGVELT